MSGMSETRGRSAPSRWWYAIAAAVILLSLLPLALTGRGIADAIRDYSVDAVDGATATVEVDDSRVAIFATGDVPGAACEATGNGFDDPVDLAQPSGTLRISLDGQDWYRIARTGEDWDDGTYEVTCSGLRDETMGYAADPKIGSALFKLLLSVILVGIAFLIALIIVLVVAIRRRRAKR